MNPHLTISASPDRTSRTGKVVNRSVSHSTALGSWNAPTRFFPAGILMPVLPPIAASAMASTVVGIWMTSTPRIHVAAKNPARSVVAPPPRPTMTSPRVMPTSASSCQPLTRTSGDLAASASGTAMMIGSSRPTRPTRPRSGSGHTTATLRPATRPANSVTAPEPILTR